MFNAEDKLCGQKQLQHESHLGVPAGIPKALRGLHALMVMALHDAEGIQSMLDL